MGFNPGFKGLNPQSVNKILWTSHVPELSKSGNNRRQLGSVIYVLTHSTADTTHNFIKPFGAGNKFPTHFAYLQIYSKCFNFYMQNLT